jgi:hypothetical protein
MITALAILYFLGIFLHFTHIMTIHALTYNDSLDMKRVMLFSAAWPLMTIWYFYELILKGDDEDDE